MPCRFASSGTVATSRSASRAILALNAASNFLRDLVISVLHRLRQSRTLHTLTFGPISGVHFSTSEKFKRLICTKWLPSLQNRICSGVSSTEQTCQFGGAVSALSRRKRGSAPPMTQLFWLKRWCVDPMTHRFLTQLTALIGDDFAIVRQVSWRH